MSNESTVPNPEMTNALLVYPRFPVTYWGLQYGLHLIGKKANLPPLGLVTLAALLPRHWRLRLVDLNVGELGDEDLRWADVVLTGGMLVQVDSLLEVVARAHRFQLRVAVGGPAPTTSPELFAAADVVFRGEAEGRVETLLSALAQTGGPHRILDAPAGFPDMKAVAVPRFDLLDLPKYASMAMQYSRGCPFRCEFCDVVEIFGRSPRVKTAEQVMAELQAIYRTGYRGTLFLVDDNFIGNKRAVRELLPLIADWQGRHGRPFELYTEASVDLATDPVLLRDMVEAGFSSVFVGIETPSTKALAETGKLQNLRIDLSEAIDRITRAGLEVMGGFIVGFDSDDESVFALQREFLARQPIPLAMIGILTALPGTALWRRLAREGRLRDRSDGDPFARPNFVPGMDEPALVRGYAKLLKWLYSPRAYYARCQANLDRMGPHPESRATTRGDVAAFLRTLWHVGILGSNRALFWRLLVRALPHGLARTRQAVVHAVKGEHVIRYTREYVLPRLQRALAEIEAEALAPTRTSTGAA